MKPSAASAPSTRVSVPLLLLLAFALGAGTSWLVTRAVHRTSPQPVIQNFIPPGISASPNVAALAPPATAGPPDVSQLSPADAARTLGNWNYDRQNWPHAIEHYEEAIARGLDNPDVRTDLGNCFRFLGQPQKALEQYELAQKQNPQHENSLFNQISLFADFLHDPARAQSIAHDFIARFPQSPQAETARQRLAQPASAPVSSPK